MLFRPDQPTFGVTHPIGLPRPIDVNDFFGARVQYFAQNLMPVPSGCLAYFDAAIYRPYIEKVAAILHGMDFGWSGPVLISDPTRYCLLRDGIPMEVPACLWGFLPEPPRVALEAVLSYFDRNQAAMAADLQLLDVVTLLSEDLDAAKFAAATANHPWVAEFLR
jgi:hypothetical protein